ncbi:hypothetical protein [Bdellovibrio svalbardensis]|uniref:Uncharacterized protein n=1 Tax=Bdellovibrio svalbardensis TaxID=2972972 RepID=A0ABT6DH06_9BACT|nr:hypothetical protein [Bdellovibrio svalbardensis]MDG0816120.1 hypothetical protein [Bdellovibrio svalbardensis]
MKLRWSILLNFLIIVAVLLAVAGFQTTFWFQVFGNVPAPLLWLNLIVYVTLYRKPFPAIFTIYAMGFILLTFTAMPLKMMWISLLILFTLVYLIKSRVFWSGSGYYTIMCGFSAVAYHLIYFFSSMVLEKNPASFEIVDRLVQIILTPSFAFPMYWILAKLDKVTQDELMHEPGGLEL